MAEVKTNDNVGSKNGSLPTKDEQKNLKQVESLLRLNLLTMQTKELLSQVSLEKPLHKKSLNGWIDSLVEDLKGDDLSAVNKEVSHAFLLKHKMTYLSLSKQANDETKILFEKPESVEIVGSYSSSTATAPLLNIDVAITIPSNVFNKKDILNHGYFDKRVLYLAGLLNSLQSLNKQRAKSNGSQCTISVASFKGDSRKPILVVSPSPNPSGIVVRLIPVIIPNIFRLVQLKLNKNNVRPEFWNVLVEKSKGTKTLLDPSILPSTPQYNQAILEDMSILLHHRIILKTILPHDCVREALSLLKVWLTQRTMRYNSDGFDGHLITLLLAYLVQTRRVSTNSTALVVFQTVLTFLSEVNMFESVLDFTKVDIEAVGATDGEDNSSLGELRHPIMGEEGECQSYNALWRVSKSSFQILRNEAQKSLLELQNTREFCFENLFMRSRGFFESYDMFFHVPINFDIELKEAQQDEFAQSVNEEVSNALLHQNTHAYYASKVRTVIEEALGDRAVTVESFVRNVDSSDLVSGSHQPSVVVSSNATLPTHGWVISVGINLNKEKVHRRVDRGPESGDSEEAAVFRTFWGEKCQLRRFQDGAIVEAVVWEQTGNSLIEDVIRYALARHAYHLCGEESENVHSVSTQLETQYFRTHIPCGVLTKGHNETVAAPMDGDKLTRSALEALDQLRTVITSKVKNLPLSIENLLAITPELRYTAVHGPTAHPILLNGSDKTQLKTLAGKTVSMLLSPITVLAKLEKSSKWPVDVEAVRKLKTAILLRTRTELMKVSEVHSVVHKDSLDVMFQGYLFRLVLVADSESEFIAGNDASLTAGFGSEAVNSHVVLPLHHIAIKGIHAQFPSYSGAVKLLAIWVANHYFSGHISHETLELIVALEYLQPTTLFAPASSLAGFYRSLIRLATHNWDSDPLIVDLSFDHTAISTSDKIDILAQFTAARAVTKKSSHESRDLVKQNVSMYIVSSSDKSIGYASNVSKRSPEKVVFHLLVSAARESASKLLTWIKDFSVKGTQSVDINLHEIMYSNAVLLNCNAFLQFNPSLYNANVTKGPMFARLDVFANSSTTGSSIKNLIARSSTNSANPIQEQVFATLKSRFGNEAVFLWNGLSGKEIGLIWRPKLFIPQVFSILDSQYRSAVSSHENVSDNSSTITVPNVTEILAQIIDSTEGLVANVILK